MAANTLVAEVFRDAVVGWRWRLRKGRNIMACSGQGYSRRIDCIRGLEVVTRSFTLNHGAETFLLNTAWRHTPDAASDIPVRFL